VLKDQQLQKVALDGWQLFEQAAGYWAAGTGTGVAFSTTVSLGSGRKKAKPGSVGSTFHG
jgi:hypothetical protein